MLAIIQAIVSIAVIVAIMLQEKSAGAGSMFGGGGGDVYQTRRGFEKNIHNITIALVVAFAGLALLNLVI
ncbi:MAG: preprotein translocase subunit SecG [Candidatus Harrisonbacteria bacterium CG10_big_fil_rev_8_21_14_0_10_42_17]|uniref:Protein-export membrane protein SecG n=1 Tax=Candidatus Harrisonbacteria bacterium CG10_big_fil_rev_8_21_14_0_10_42_17 TaxID=1974584 RepID=A0A2M6WJ89_9BACT|nr:MAG: preprotein translocase subunit SecG [Candidatus Harrisonbacteria bacterium CG10_big_fil_rev_8_21_14_0_10_42_17]